MAHRTQLILEEWQYDGARAIAESSGVSLASVVREAVSQYLSNRDTAHGSSLEELRGIGHDPGLSGIDHDEVLYGSVRPESKGIENKASKEALPVRRRA